MLMMLIYTILIYRQQRKTNSIRYFVRKLA